jgi:hypothetical protein
MVPTGALREAEEFERVPGMLGDDWIPLAAIVRVMRSTDPRARSGAKSLSANARSPTFWMRLSRLFSRHP